MGTATYGMRSLVHSEINSNCKALAGCSAQLRYCTVEVVFCMQAWTKVLICTYH